MLPDYRYSIRKGKSTKMGDLFKRYLFSGGGLMFLAPGICNEEFFPKAS